MECPERVAPVRRSRGPTASLSKGRLSSGRSCSWGTSAWACRIQIFALAWGCTSRLAAADEQKKFTLGVFLHTPGRMNMERIAMDVSTPGSPRYGSYYSQMRLAEETGVKKSTVDEAVKWLTSSLAIVGTNSSVNPQVTAHRDAVLVTLEDFYPTYHLGAALKNGSVETPTGVELIVTPSSPPGFCEDRNGEKECTAAAFCKWNSTNCTGETGGWMLSLTPKGDLDGADLAFLQNGVGGSSMQQRWKRRRRGRVWGRPTTPEAAAQRAIDDQGTNFTKAKNLGFWVSPMSEGIRILQDVAVHPNGSSLHPVDWSSLEVAYTQGQVHHQLILTREDFTEAPLNATVALIGGLRNVRRVIHVAVCLNEGPPGPWQKGPGCHCDPTTGRDFIGRQCQVLGGLGPEKNPVDFVVPLAPESLSALQRHLGVTPGTRAGGGKSVPEVSQAVAEFAEETYDREDVVRAFEAYGLDLSMLHVSDDGPAPKRDLTISAAAEGSLDLQVIATLAPGARTVWSSIEQTNIDGFMLAYMVRLNNEHSPALVHSVSWGDAEGHYPPKFVERLDYELMKAALRGISMIISTGDNGINCGLATCKFTPCIIGSSRWVTSVGATMQSEDAVPYCREEAFQSRLGECEERGHSVCSSATGALITSSGYWSIYRETPDYQEEAVAQYLRENSCVPCKAEVPEGKTAQGDGNMTTDLAVDQPWMDPQTIQLESLLGRRRASPDVAAPGHRFPVFLNGSVVFLDGTSASSPSFAAIVSLLNAEQLRRGEGPMGLLNPWLYSIAKHPGTFFDVTMGDIGANEQDFCPWGFRAAPGWDAATGLGVPHFERLKEHLPRRGLTEALQASATESLHESDQPEALAMVASQSPLLVRAATLAAAGLVLFALAMKRVHVWPRAMTSGGAAQSLLESEDEGPAYQHF
eukprot:CAMPEP_0170582412 /NCGR_PEP_ID=MMETSP0224-20130122/7570_1 /TAXON_ID=285029 /ORGANISM="Togula jolla, Strain CCCM 725" /LENGTH=918 /DNA_ID=CAMNT_0010905635 /DNA_START=23 /DNA_END=2779 /DNA_ORIENTATION=-